MGGDIRHVCQKRIIMEKHQFECVADFFGLNPEERRDTSLENLNKIAIKGLHALPYSTLQIHCENEPVTRLDWSTIYDKLINQNRGGLCYERDETLYQVLNFIGYEVYRIEVSGIVGAKAVEPRHDHMAIGVKLNNAWYLCDIGWGGFMYEGALAITTEPTLTRRFTARCVESAYHTSA